MKDIAELNRLYTEGESADLDLYSEQRSNVRLVTGDHYTNKNSRFWSRIRDTKQITSEAKIRLTKNHIQKITKTYINNILAHAPGVGISPKNENELQDQKAAELAHAVWQDLKHRQKLNKKIREWAKDYIDIGEVFVKVFFDPKGGEFKGFEAEVQRGEDGEPVRDPMGNVIPSMDENGEMVPTNKAIFSGALAFERFHAFNVIRDSGAKSMDDSTFICLRKMSQITDLKAMVDGDEEKLKFIQQSSQDTFNVFDGSTGRYDQVKGQCMVREYYFRSCTDYPKGYYYITTENGILFEGELPFGIWPIHYAGFDEAATSPRARSVIKVLRPYQAEVNRSASKIAEHQVTLGDDKLLIQAGTKLTHGGTLAGVRGVQYSGAPPGILQGRSGEQYLKYMEGQIKEMYQASNVMEDTEENNSNLEPYTLLYRSIRNKKKFSMYGTKFEEFLVSICECSLDLAKNYYSDEMLIPAIGKREYINIKEFKNTTPMCYQVKVEPQTDDIETKMGKQMAMNTVIQYASKELGKENIGRLIKAMPFVNDEEAFADLTMDYENGVNDILQLDRGEYPNSNKYENIPYLIKRLVQRRKQSDFDFLNQQIKMNYDRKIMELEQMQAKIQSDLLAIQADYIPTGGYLVGCDFYVQDQNKPGSTRRARIPYQSLDWLIKRLEQQGMSLENVEGMNQQALVEIGQMSRSPQQSSPQVPPQMGQGMNPAQSGAGMIS